MKRMTKKWLALMLAATLVVGDGSMVRAAESYDGSDVVSDSIGTVDGEDFFVSTNMFPGVAEGVSLGESYEEYQENLVSNMDIAGNFIEGVECVENEILVMVDSEELAQEYATAFNGSLAKYYDGLATITLNADDKYAKASVADAVMASANPENNLPVAWPNTYYYIQPVEESAAIDGAGMVEEVDSVSNGEIAVNALDDFSVANASVMAYNDPYLKTKSSAYQWFHAAIGSASAWNSGYTGKGVKVAVIDTGAELGHEDLNVTRHKVSTLSSLEDSEGHGSHVCGLVGAKAGNGKGGTGVAPEVTLHSIKVSDGSSIDTANVWEALSMAKSLDVDMINMSLGGPLYNGTYEKKVEDLYNAGIAVFCAAGNESTSAWAYPASYKGAISIAALDKNMQTTYFTNYGTSVDFAAPGYDIWSCYNTSTASYTSMPGTSMACPIATGTGAVLLQYARANGLYKEQNKKADVDNLIKLMTKGAVKAGNGAGKGYVSIPKAMGLGSATLAPSAPKFSSKAGTYDVEGMNITIASEGATTVYYSLNGKTPTYKNGVVSNGTLYKGAIYVGGNKSVTVKAIAVNNSAKLVSKVATAKYTFKPKASALVMNLTSVPVMAGKSVTLKATVSPSYVANKKVNWTISPEGKGVTVKNGKVTASSSAVAGKYVVTATAADGSNVKASATVQVVAAVANPISKIKVKTKGSISVANGTNKQVELEATKKDKSAVAVQGNVIFYSENPAVANVSTVTGNMVTIVGAAKGKTNIIGVASDGSGVTVKIPVTVGNKVASIKLTGKNFNLAANTQLAKGKSVSLTAVVNPSDAAVKNVVWSVNPANKGVTVKGGKVTASKSATNGAYTITATAADGYGATASTTVTVINSMISSIKFKDKTASVFRVENAYSSSTSTVLPVTVEGGAASNWDVTTNAPGLVSVSKSGSNVVVTATGQGTGTATVTVTTTDGSNKKATCKVTVKNPATKLLLSVPAGRCYSLARGKSVQLLTTLESEYGKVDASAKKFTWTSSNPNIMTVDAKGKVTAKTNSGSATITAVATDGSGVSASVDLNATLDVTGIKIANNAYGLAFSNQYKLKLGQTGALYLLPQYSKTDNSGALYTDAFTYKVSGNGIGIRPASGGFYIAGNKKGTYSITVSCQNGSKASATVKITIY